jgi:dynactin complex subunit
MAIAKGAYTAVKDQVIGIVLASAVSTFVATKVLDVRVSALEVQAKEARGDLKQIAENLNKMAVSVAELSAIMKTEIQKNDRLVKPTR